MEKNLPIKIFKKRTDDKRLVNLAVVNTEAMGGRFKLEGEALNNRVSSIRAYFGHVSEKLSTSKQNI